MFFVRLYYLFSLLCQYFLSLSDISYAFYPHSNEHQKYNNHSYQKQSYSTPKDHVPWFLKKHHLKLWHDSIGINYLFYGKAFSFPYSERIFSLIVWSIYFDCVDTRTYTPFSTRSLQIPISSKRFKEISPSESFSIQSRYYTLTLYDIYRKICSVTRNIWHYHVYIQQKTSFSNNLIDIFLSG